MGAANAEMSFPSVNGRPRLASSCRRCDRLVSRVTRIDQSLEPLAAHLNRNLASLTNDNSSAAAKASGGGTRMATTQASAAPRATAVAARLRERESKEGRLDCRD